MVQAILLVPEEGDPHGLLGDSKSAAWRCGARPPTAGLQRTRRLVHEGNEYADPTMPCETCVACGEVWPCDTPGKVEREASERWIAGYSFRPALVLAYQGEVVVEGCFKIEGLLFQLGCDECPSWRLLFNRSERVLVEVRPAAFHLLARMVSDLGRIVLLNEAGEEIER